ncbi:hypothetical protein, partial [Faecalibaculum rodentium]|uniref:hypothetical protein n=4 Tax=Faecalibaculum rodentium TaxID=1702221 RepID=UPI00260F0B47
QRVATIFSRLAAIFQPDRQRNLPDVPVCPLPMFALATARRAGIARKTPQQKEDASLQTDASSFFLFM